ncbi:hypothetical protein FFK22_014450 [Mycobacterium sp. KBS0706]|uniref:hypothetical protein n=1 Tax=Mycobacterium sp. KBS0706 TaxID=2578109 RepID=UPI00110F7C8A|nr:hypothetical protein [Mycobacterium sp. KBS0706]TSD88034.1 hypothetical protein FFK22_014450 [Mycobacterium sp. KBS0706]
MTTPTPWTAAILAGKFAPVVARTAANLVMFPPEYQPDAIEQSRLVLRRAVLDVGLLLARHNTPLPGAMVDEAADLVADAMLAELARLMAAGSGTA